MQCDGRRPRCSACVAKDRACGYVGDPGQSRAEAMKSRLKSLEVLVATRQTGEATGERAGLSRSQHSHDSMASGFSSDARELGPSGAVQGKSVPDRDPHHSLPETQSPASWTSSAPASWTTQRAIDAFFYHVGHLFHVYSRQQLHDFAREDVQAPSQDLDGASKAVKAVGPASVSAVAAVGCQYIDDAQDGSAGVAHYDTARFHLDAIFESHLPDAIKLCVLLALYNLPSKATAALSYVEMGLGLARRLGLDHDEYRDADVSPHIWLQYRKAWRALTFFS
jgi:hypothetical protein